MIKKDPASIRIHDSHNQAAILESLRQLGAGRSILIDADEITIGGNGVLDAAHALGVPVRIVESDGSELIAIKRTDLAPNDPRRRAMAIADNRTSDLSFFDDDALSALLADCENFTLATGFSEEDIARLESLGGMLADLEDNHFANRIKMDNDVFSVTFTFSKSAGGVVAEYVRKPSGKTKIVAHIIDFCSSEVENA